MAPRRQPVDPSLRNLSQYMRKKKIMEFLKQGLPRDEIAVKMGTTIARVEQVIRAQFARLDRDTEDVAMEARELECMRLDAYLVALSPQILGINADGTPYRYKENGGSRSRAIEVAIKISERRARLRGLDAPATSQNLNISAHLAQLTGSELLQEAERLGLVLPSQPLLPLPLPGEQANPSHDPQSTGL